MKPLTKIGLVALGCLLGLLLIAGCLGHWHNSQSGGDIPTAFFNVGKTESHSNLSSGAGSCALENATFSARRVVLLADHSHPLIRRVADLLAQQLTDSATVEELETTNLPFVQRDGTRAPDLFLQLELTGLQESGLLSKSIRSTVNATLGDKPWQSTTYMSDGSSGPMVMFNWNATLETESIFSGIRSDRYADTARSIADELTKAIRTQIEDLSAKYPPIPELPADFFGPYKPVADFDFMNAFSVERVASYCGLFTHNQTFWRFQTATNPVPKLRRIAGALAAAGWKIQECSLTNTLDYRIHATSVAESELEIFRLHTEGMFSPDTAPATHLEFVVHYRKAFSQAEREAALEKLFSGPRPVEAFLPFQYSFSATQRARFYALAEKSPATSPTVSAQLAEIYFDQRQTNAAIAMLQRAKALSAAANDPTTLDSRISALAQKISPYLPLQLTVTPEVCRELGFLEITNASQTLEQLRSLGQPLWFFRAGKSGVKIFCLTIQPPHKEVYPWTLVQVGENMRCSESSTFTLSGPGGWQHACTFTELNLKITGVPLPDRKQFEFTIQSTEDKSGAGRGVYSEN